jgi:hypothetical protein
MLKAGRYFQFIRVKLLAQAFVSPLVWICTNGL